MPTKISKHLKRFTAYLKTHRILVVSLIFNLLVFVGLILILIAYRQTIISRLISQIFIRFDSVSSYHLSANLAPYNAQFESDYIQDITKYKQTNLQWNYQDKLNNINFIYNQDNFFLRFNSPQLTNYLTTSFYGTLSNKMSKSDLNQLHETILKHPLITGESYLHLDKTTLDNIGPRPESEKEHDILESKRLVNEQIIKSLHLNGIPTIIKENKNYYLKIPLKIEYETLNAVLYPAIKEYFVNNQPTLKEILDQITVNVYVNKAGYIDKIIIISPPLTKEQAETIFIDEKANSFTDLSNHMMTITTADSLSLSLQFSAYNEPVEITPPSNVVKPQDLINILQAPAMSPPKTSTSKYTINNAYPRKSISSDIFKDFAMVSSMLYRYYNEHESYPLTLDPLANAYFPGMVPGNAQTGQGFSYSTFDNNQGYLLCPTPSSGREYCYKKFKLNEIN